MDILNRTLDSYEDKYGVRLDKQRIINLLESYIENTELNFDMVNLVLFSQIQSNKNIDESMEHVVKICNMFKYGI